MMRLFHAMRLLIVRWLRAIPREEHEERMRLTYHSGFWRGIRQGKDIMVARFNRTGSLSPHHHVTGFTAQGRPILSKNARMGVAAALRKKADEVGA